MKYVYFVRHGETEGNAAQTFQDASSPLSAKGLQQAALVGQRFKSIPIDVIFASHMIRARQTAQAIAMATDIGVIESELFHEVMRPSVVHGKHWDDPAIAHIVKHFRKHFTSDGDKHSDEENFHDVKSRALKALAFIENRREERICVVTHGTFLKMMMSVMMKREKTTPDFFEAVDEFMFPSNTGISMCEEGRYRPQQWVLMEWNDDAHLGELTT